MNSIVKILSWRDWGIVRYNSIFQNLSALYFIAYVGLHWNLTFIVNSLLFIFFSILMTGYGYLINDFADIDLDKHHQKPNSFANTKKSLAIWILLGVLICGAIFSLPFIKNIWFVIIWGIWIFVATTYSLPPLRFKEKGTLGLITTVLGQQVLPVALLFAAFTTPWSWGVFILILFTFSRGVSSDLGHQIRDWINDSQTDTCTFAVKIGYKNANSIYMTCLEFERIILGLVLMVFWYYFPKVGLSRLGLQISWILPLVLVYITLIIKTLGSSWRAWRRGNLEQNDPYDEVRQHGRFDSLHIIHHTFPTVVMPFYLASTITLIYLPNFIFILIIILVFNLYRFDLWKRFISYWFNK